MKPTEGARGAGGTAGDPDGSALIEAVAGGIVRRGLSVPAILFLETSKPLSTIGSNALVFLEPFLRDFFRAGSYDRCVALLEDRRNLEALIVRIEELEEEARQKRDKAKRLKHGRPDAERPEGSDRDA